MSESRDSDNDRSRSAKGPPDGERSVASSIALVGGVVAVLVLGAFLRSQPQRDAAEEIPAAIASRPAPVPAPAPGNADPAPRAALPSSSPRDADSAPPATGAWGPAAPAAATPRPTAAAPSPPPAPVPADARAATLTDRAARDAKRLAGKRDRYTAQIVLACQPDGVERILQKGGSTSSLYLLPAEVSGKSCFRVVWGTYPSRKEAARAADLPAALRGREAPSPKAVAEILR